MAMYEKLGDCPHDWFARYEREGKHVPDIWNRTRELLGDRTLYMVYTESGCAYKTGSYLVDCLIGAENTMGVEIACLLKHLVPKCNYMEVGRKILVTDVINPFQIPYISRGHINNEVAFISNNDGMHVFEDDRYICGVMEEGNDVHMYFYKK